MAAGIYPTATGFRAIASIGRGKRTEKAFPKGTAVRTMVRWQEDARRELRDRPVAREGSFTADITAYLEARASMPTHAERQRHLELWATALGGARQRETVTP